MKQKYKVFINDQEIEFVDFEVKESKNQMVLTNITAEQLLAIVTDSKNKSIAKYVINDTDPATSFYHFVTHFKLIKAAGGIVMPDDNSGKILMIFRLGFWDLPKGKIDSGESIEEAALREVEEECGIGNLVVERKLQNTWHLYLHKGQWVAKQTYWFLMLTSDTNEPRPQESENITQANWVSPEELKTILPLSYASIRDLIEFEILGGGMNSGN